MAALLAVSSPLAAQDEYVWTSSRPDAHAPLGVALARTLDAGAIELTYKFSQMNSRGVWYLTDSIPLAQTLGDYQVAPLSMSRQTHTLMGAWGFSDAVTLTATAEFGVFEREHLTSTSIYYIAGAEELGDVTASIIYEIHRGGPFRMNVSGGVVLPTGKARTWAQTPFSGAGEEALPYDMRPGGGKLAFTGGISGQVQNEFGSVGAQFRGRINTGAGFGDLDFTPGDTYQANGWAAYRV